MAWCPPGLQGSDDLGMADDCGGLIVIALLVRIMGSPKDHGLPEDGVLRKAKAVIYAEEDGGDKNATGPLVPGITGDPVRVTLGALHPESTVVGANDLSRRLILDVVHGLDFEKRNDLGTEARSHGLGNVIPRRLVPVPEEGEVTLHDRWFR